MNPKRKALLPNTKSADIPGKAGRRMKKAE